MFSEALSYCWYEEIYSQVPFQNVNRTVFCKSFLMEVHQVQTRATTLRGNPITRIRRRGSFGVETQEFERRHFLELNVSSKCGPTWEVIVAGSWLACFVFRY